MTMSRTLFRVTLLFLAGLAWSGLVRAEPVLIVHPANGVERLTQDEVTNIYMGRLRQFPNGAAALPLDLPADHPAKARFYELLVGRSLAEINAYWARLIFSGRTQPPRESASEEDIIEAVARNRRAIGYVDRARVDKRVRIILELKP
jgi:ABC-type phosphate transport system substrate-binding protein